MSRTYLRGEIYYADLDPVVGSEQMGTRPVLILQNNVGNHFARTVIVAPITSRIHAKSKLPTHSYIGMIGRMKYPSVVMLEQLRTLDKRRIGYYIGRLPEEKMQDVTRALCVSLAIRPKASTIPRGRENTSVSTKISVVISIPVPSSRTIVPKSIPVLPFPYRI